MATKKSRRDEGVDEINEAAIDLGSRVKELFFLKPAILLISGIWKVLGIGTGVERRKKRSATARKLLD